MSFLTKETERDQFSRWEQLKRQALQLRSQTEAWNIDFNNLRANVDAEKQAELDNMKTQLIQALRNEFSL